MACPHCVSLFHLCEFIFSVKLVNKYKIGICIASVAIRSHAHIGENLNYSMCRVPTQVKQATPFLFVLPSCYEQVSLLCSTGWHVFTFLCFLLVILLFTAPQVTETKCIPGVPQQKQLTLCLLRNTNIKRNFIQAGVIVLLFMDPL